MAEKKVIYKTDFSDMPELTEEEKEALKALADLSEEDINTSDVPPLDESFWKTAERGKFSEQVKKHSNT
jgi:hypothetical protein